MKNNRLLPFMMWFFPLSFFAFQFILRLWPSLLMQNIMEQFNINATAFGILASAYYYGYAGFQIPMAIFIDRYGVRIVLFLSALTASLSILAFNYTESWLIALASRFLIGLSSAAGFLTTSKIISGWFSQENYARMIGFSFTIGILGAVYGGKPTSILIEQFGSQKISIILALISSFIAILSYTFVRNGRKSISHNKDSEKSNESKPIELKDLTYLLRDYRIWLLALTNLLMVGSLEGFADVWGVNYLIVAYQLTKSEAASLTSLIFIGMIFGGPLLATLAKKINNYNVVTICGAGMSMLFLILINSPEKFNLIGLKFLFLTIGILCCYQVIIFSIGNEMVDKKYLGVTVAFLNCINMLGGVLFHTFIGIKMDHAWTGIIENGIRKYSLNDYQSSLIIIPLCAILGTMIINFIAKKDSENSKIN